MSKLLITFLTLIFAPVAMALTIATGSPGGTYYRIGEDIKKLTAKAGLQIQVLATNGSFDNINLLGKGHYKQTEALARLKQGEIDAMIFVAGAPVSVFKDLGADFTLVRLPQNPVLDQFYARTVLGKDSYSWAKDNVATYAVPSVIVMVDSGTENQLLEMIKLVLAILEGQKQLKKNGHPKWNDSQLGIVYEDVGYTPTNDIIKIHAILDGLGYDIVKRK